MRGAEDGADAGGVGGVPEGGVCRFAGSVVCVRMGRMFLMRLQQLGSKASAEKDLRWKMDRYSEDPYDPAFVKIGQHATERKLHKLTVHLPSLIKSRPQLLLII